MVNIYRHISILAVIAAAAMVFALEHSSATRFAPSYGAIPSLVGSAWSALVGGEVSLPVIGALSRLFTAIFLHGGIEHIVYNMVFLWAFGLLASQILGQWWALAIFVFCGICGNVLQVWLNPESLRPIIGASGAVCGFQGLYLGLALRWRLPWPDVWPLAHPIPPLQLAAFAVLGFIFDMVMLANHDQQIAYGAHIGGFVSGFAIATFLTTVYPTIATYQRAGGRYVGS